MDLEQIRRLAAGGVAAYPPTALPSAAAWLWDFGEATGEARYCSVSRSLEMISAAFDANYEVLPSVVLADLDRILATQLPDVLGAALAPDGSTFARLMREAIAHALTGIP